MQCNTEIGNGILAVVTWIVMIQIKTAAVFTAKIEHLVFKRKCRHHNYFGRQLSGRSPSALLIRPPLMIVQPMS